MRSKWFARAQSLEPSPSSCAREGAFEDLPVAAKHAQILAVDDQTDRTSVAGADDDRSVGAEREALVRLELPLHGAPAVDGDPRPDRADSDELDVQRPRRPRRYGGGWCGRPQPQALTAPAAPEPLTRPEPWAPAERRGHPAFRADRHNITPTMTTAKAARETPM